MKNKLSLIIPSVIVVCISIIILGSLISAVPSYASSARAIDMKYGAAVEAVTQIRVGTGILHYVSGFASGGANATYAIHDAASVAGASTTTGMAEGGEASQYDSIPTLDFGDDGLPFTKGLLIWTTTCSIAVQYK